MSGVVDPRVLVVIDKFKGTLTAAEAATCVAAGFRSVFPNMRIDTFPLADGGEGSSAIAGEAIGAQRVELEVCGPHGEPVRGFYYRKNGKALIELAAASGLVLVDKTSGRSACSATTFGFGQLIRHAVENGATEIQLFLGGSASTDGGIGFAKALGARFFDARGDLIPGPTGDEPYAGERLGDVARIELSELHERLGNVSIVAAVDVDNPLCGENGCAAIYGPQKGLTPTLIPVIDGHLSRIAKLVSKTIDRNYADVPGAGAAGGSGFGVLAFLNGRLVPGSDFFLDLIEFERLAKEADYVITGEGKIDSQSLSGKLLSAICKRCEKLQRPVIAFGGILGLTPEELGQYPQLRAFGLGRDDCLTKTELSLSCVVGQVASLMALVRKVDQ
ncbi:MAG: glycerate kinase [Deltaproteobacteria bacterium]|nr:glycerate kinase [Deltaproteobacteria bacterium]